MKEPLLLVAIHSLSDKSLFRVYRDYLIFINLVRELVNSHQHSIFGFSWLNNEAWFLLRPADLNLLRQLLSLLKRYYLWLQHQEETTRQFKLRALPIKEQPQALDVLRYIHQRAIQSGQVTDALDYHWHSYPVYQDFWQLNWLNTKELLSYYSINPILAMNAFREHMQQPSEKDYALELEEPGTDDNSNNKYWHQEPESVVAEVPKHPYYQTSNSLTLNHREINYGFELSFDIPT